MRYALIEQARPHLPVKRGCALLGVSESGYYAWRQREADDKVAEETALVAQIQAIHQQSRATYGSPRVTAALRQVGIVCNRKRVARLMRKYGIVAKQRRRGKRTTNAHHAYPLAPNLLQRQFSAQRPNEKWLADITYLDTAEGWLYLAVVLDVYSRKIVGWAMATHLESSLVEAALGMALRQRCPLSEPLLHHSDRGSQYASGGYRALLQAYGIEVSMSSTGNCYDNAMMESFFGTLKTECADYCFATRERARTEVFHYLEGWYNRRRLHSALGYQSPDAFEQAYHADKP